MNKVQTLHSIKLLTTVKALKMPLPQSEHRFEPKRRWKIDWVWLLYGLKIGLEVEGGVWKKGRHTSPKGFLSDMEKYNAATLKGFVMLRTTPQKIFNGEVVTLLESIKAMLEQAKETSHV